MGQSSDVGAAQAELLGLINAAWATQVVRAACVHGLPDRIAAGAGSTKALAAAAGCDADALERLLHAMASIGLCEAGPDAGTAPRWRLTPTGECLRLDHPHSLRHWALHAGGPLWQRQGELADAVRTGHNWAQRRGGAHTYEQLAADPAAAAVFHLAMVELTRAAIPQILRLIDVGNARTVVDVGGGRGELLGAILARHDSMRGVLFDQPLALDGASETLSQAGVAGRCRIEGGDFFAAVPSDGDLYLMKSVLHNWSDAHCQALLVNCAQAMPHGARLLVIERAMPDQPGLSAQHKACARADLNMLVGLTGRERRAADYVRLLASAGLQVMELRAPAHCNSRDSPGGEWSLFEARHVSWSIRRRIDRQ
jgi:hypothetical protein